MRTAVVEHKDPVNPQDASAPARVALHLARWSFYALIVLIPFRKRILIRAIEIPPIYGDYTDILLFAADIAHLAVLLFWAAALLFEQRKPHTGPWFVTWPMLGILAAGITSSFQSVAPEISWMHVVRLALLLGLYLYLVNEIRDLRTLLLPIAVQVSIQSVVAIAQHLQQRSLGLHFLGELALNPTWPGVSIVWAPGEVALRSYGLSDHPNILGGSLALGLVILLAQYPRAPRSWRLPLAGVHFIGIIALLFTFSRSAWLAFAAGGALVALWLYRRGDGEAMMRLLRLAGLSLLVAGPFVLGSLPFLASRFGLNTTADPVDPELLSPEGASTAERAALAEAANEMFVQRPLLGVGLGTFPVALQPIRPDLGFDYQPVHMVLMDAAVETGLFGGLAYTLAAALPFAAVGLLPAARRSPDLIAACAVSLAVIIIGLFDYYPWFLVPGRLWHWTIWGLTASAYTQATMRHD